MNYSLFLQSTNCAFTWGETSKYVTGLINNHCASFRQIYYLVCSVWSWMPHFCLKSYYLCRGGYVWPGVCLVVCLLATSLKSTDRISMKILPEMYLWTKKNWLNFWSHSALDPDLGFFWRILQHSEIRHFSINRLLFLEDLIGASWKFYKSCIFKQESSHEISKVILIQIETRIPTVFALAEVRHLRVFLIVIFAFLCELNCLLCSTVVSRGCHAYSEQPSTYSYCAHRHYQ